MITLKTFYWREAPVCFQPGIQMKPKTKKHITSVEEPFHELQIQEMFTPNFSAAMNRLLNRSLCATFQLHWLKPDTRPAKPLPTSLRRKLKLRWHWAYGTYLEKATCVSQCRVAKTASCWPADGLNSDITFTTPSTLIALHVGFMCDDIKTVFLRIRFPLRPFPPRKRIKRSL